MNTKRPNPIIKEIPATTKSIIHVKLTPINTIFSSYSSFSLCFLYLKLKTLFISTTAPWKQMGSRDIHEEIPTVYKETVREGYHREKERCGIVVQYLIMAERVWQICLGKDEWIIRIKLGCDPTQLLNKPISTFIWVLLARQIDKNWTWVLDYIIPRQSWNRNDELDSQFIPIIWI